MAWGSRGWWCWCPWSMGRNGTRSAPGAQPALPTQLFDPGHHVAIGVVDPVEVDEGLVGGGLVVQDQEGAAEVVEEAQGVVLGEVRSFEATVVPLHGQLG